jgi:hypothetical protein
MTGCRMIGHRMTRRDITVRRVAVYHITGRGPTGMAGH